MNKQALVKLAQIRLAIDYVLRNRLVKAADVRTEYTNPGDYNYNPYQGYNFDTDEFESYDASRPMPLNKFKKKTTMRELKPSQVTTRKNTYSNVKPTERPERLNERLHRYLFGFPEHDLNLNKDVDTGYENRAKAKQEYMIPFQYERSEATKAYINSIKGLIDKWFPGYKESWVPISRVNPFSREVSLSLIDDQGLPIQVPVPLSSNEAFNLTKDQRRMHNAEKNFSKEYNFIEPQLGEHPMRWANHPEEWWDKHRSNLMQAYREQSPLGMAHKVFPSMTRVPWAIYQASPFLWKANWPGELQRWGINLSK